MAGGRRIPVTVEADTDGDFNKAARGLEGVAKDADDADVSLRKLSKGHQVLTTEIDKTKTSVRSLREEFARTGDTGLLGDIDKQERSLRKLQTQFTKIFGEIGNDGGHSLTRGVQESLQEIATSVPKLGIPLAVGLTAALSPAIAAAIAAGVSVGFGGGVIALGISRAVQDTRVGAAWGNMWANVERQLDSRSAAMVQPLIDASRSIGNAFDMDVIPKIGDAFDKLAPRVADIGSGLGQMMTNIFKGDNFDRVIAMADRMIGQFAKELPNLGNAVNNFLGSIADSAPGAEQFWSEFLVGTQRTVVGIGNVIEALSKTYKAMDDFGNGINDAFDKASVVVGDFVTDAYHKLDDFGNKANDAFDKLFGINRGDGDNEPTRKLFKLKDVTDQAGMSALLTAEDFGALTSQVNQTANTFDSTYAAAVDKVLSTTMNLDQTTLGFAESQTRLADSVDRGGRSLDIHTKAGQANREAILGVVTANQQQFDAMIRAGAGADEARGAYDANTRALEDQMRAMHFTEDEIQGMVGKYRTVPGDIKTEIILKGLAEAIGGLNDTLREINHLDGQTATTYVRTVHQQIFADPVGHFTPNGNASGPAQRHGGFVAAAHGMIVDSPTVLFGERGTKRETYVPWAGISSQRAYELMAPTARNFGLQVTDPRQSRSGYSSPVSVGGGGGGGRNYAITVNVPLGASAADVGGELVEAIKGYEQLNGSGWRN